MNQTRLCRLYREEVIMAYLLQMAGFPGSGKIGLAELIVAETGAIVIDRDVIKNAMLGLWNDDRRKLL